MARLRAFVHLFFSTVFTLTDGLVLALIFSQGATTFPSITEALTLDKDVRAANFEAEKVAVLIQAMADRLQ